MPGYFDKAEIFAWMPLIGFDKASPDMGIGTFINRAGFTPHGVCQFLFHLDIINNHSGMDEVKVLPPDNCMYHGAPYNEERRRQEWTNHDIRDLTKKLNSEGIQSYLSIMGATNNNRFHQEWISDHPDLFCLHGSTKYSINVLKRFKDGSYYEDFFADKLCEVMEDYGFTGLHVAEGICPCFTPASGDYSFDLVDQFVAKTGHFVPDTLLQNIDSEEILKARQKWIWENLRAEWIGFLASRWEAFWKKICDRLHAIGRKVFVLGMYCTDPFVTLYAKGIDLRKIANAGVDYLMPNMHANPSMILKDRPWRYYEWAQMVSLTDAFVPKAKKLNMLCVKDAAEEWDLLHHAPTFLDRDISFLPSFMRYDKNSELKRSLDGYNICLADGIYEEEWKWLRERFEIAFDEVPEKVLTPTLVWSDYAFDQTLPEYIKTRRWTLHKFIYEINIQGAHCGATVRCEDITEKCGDLFIPNFDLLSEEEKTLITNYKGGMVIATAAKDRFRKDDFNCELYFEDNSSPYPMCAFVLNGKIKNKEEILEISKEDNGGEILEDVANAEEMKNSLNDFMPYQKVSSGFVKALAELIKLPYSHLFKSTHPIIPMQMKDGRIRVYAMNDDLLRYGKAIITVNAHIEKVTNVSKFPLLPVKFSPTEDFTWTSQDYPGDFRIFRLLIPQGGVSIVDVHLSK